MLSKPKAVWKQCGSSVEAELSRVGAGGTCGYDEESGGKRQERAGWVKRPVFGGRKSKVHQFRGRLCVIDLIQRGPLRSRALRESFAMGGTRRGLDVVVDPQV